MTFDDRPDVTDLVRLLEQPGPLPGTFEEDLRAELLESLAQGPLAPAPDAEHAGDADVIELGRRRAPAPRSRPSRTPWLLAAAAVLVLVLAVALGPLRQRKTTTTDNPNPTPVPVLTDIGAACARFVDTTPVRAELESQVDGGAVDAPAELRQVVDAFDVLLIDAVAAQVAQADLDALDLTRSRFNQTLLFLEAGDVASAANSLDGANAELGGLADDRFVPCRSY